MRIVYDHQIFSQQPYGGISRYFYEIADRLSRDPRCTINVLAPTHANEYLRDARPGLVLGKKIPGKRTYRARYAANEALSRLWLRSHAVDVVHETYYSRRRAARSDAKVVLTVLDMIHERLPQYFPPTDHSAEVKRSAIARADHIICISEHTRKDLLDLVNVDPAKVSVVHLGHSLRVPHRTRARCDTAGNNSAPYLLFVGQRGGYKNFAGMLKAIASSALLRDMRILAFGGGPFTSAELAHIGSLGLSPEMVQQRSGGDAELSAVYSGALALVYPSLYEGFGIPPLEAMAHNCPVVCSSTSSLPEVVGDAAELFDPYDPDSMVHAIEYVVASPARAAELRVRGRQRVDLFSWDQCAASTLAVYRGVLGT